MIEVGRILAYVKRCRLSTSYKGEIEDIPNSVINGNFHVDTPNKLCFTDVTQFTILSGKVNLSFIVNVSDGMPASSTIRKSLTDEMVNTMLKMLAGVLEVPKPR